jgi:serine/threonine protein kinase
MSTYTSEPGTQLAGRYRLVDQTSAGTGWTYWKATDETLARPITVLTFAAGFPRIAEAVTAARAASRFSDPRFSQVFDVEDDDEHAYVVTEWPAGESLLDMLAGGPLDPPRAVSLVSEAAQALAAAHAAGLAHLRLQPACLHWTAGGGVKITGLGVDAALAGMAPAGPEDGELTDTRDLARLLYAALTGYWPGLQIPSEALGSPEIQESGEAREPAGADEFAAAEVAGPAWLPPAPEADGLPCTPRQVSAAVPANIDAVTCQALFQRPSRHGPALSTPAMFADALASVAPPDPLPAPAAATATLRAPGGRDYQPAGPAGPYEAADPMLRTRAGAAYRRSPSERSSVAAATVSAVIVLILAAAGVVGWSISHRPQHASAAPPAQSPSSSGPSVAASAVLKPVSANSFDALGNDGGDEDGSAAKYAIDNNPGTFWHTDYYLNYPALGNLKKGTGLILDMGEQVRLSQVVVQFGTSCCTHVEIEIGNDNHPVPSALGTFTAVQGTDKAVGSTVFNVTNNTTGRYVLIWITYLPPLAGSAGQYEAQIYNVVVHGSAVSRSG